MADSTLLLGPQCFMVVALGSSGNHHEVAHGGSAWLFSRPVPLVEVGAKSEHVSAVTPDTPLPLPLVLPAHRLEFRFALALMSLLGPQCFMVVALGSSGNHHEVAHGGSAWLFSRPVPLVEVGAKSEHVSAVTPDTPLPLPLVLPAHRLEFRFALALMVTSSRKST